MSSAVRISNQNRASFMEKHRRAKEQAIGEVKRACSGLGSVCMYYNDTWRVYFGWEAKLGGIMEGLLEDYKKEYESYLRIYGYSMELTGDGGLSEDDKYITSLTVASGSGNGVSRLEMVEFKQLKDIRIGDNCFAKVIRFNVDGLSCLGKLVVGKKSFTSGGYVNKYYYTDRSFIVRNCPRLTLIDIGDCSFAEWGGEWVLSGLDQLERLRIVSENEESYNFNGSPFVIKGECVSTI